jgi:hypothetical protein
MDGKVIGVGDAKHVTHRLHVLDVTRPFSHAVYTKSLDFKAKTPYDN